MTRDQLIRLFGDERTYITAKRIVLDCTGVWHEDEAITAENSMFADDDSSEDVTVPNLAAGSEDPTVPRYV